jgi:hypothetical protein
MQQINSGQIFGKVNHTFVKLEYQERGAPHYHLLIWLENKTDACKHVSAAFPIRHQSAHVAKKAAKVKKQNAAVEKKDVLTLLCDRVEKYQLHRCDDRCLISRTCSDVQREMHSVCNEIESIKEHNRNGTWDQETSGSATVASQRLEARFDKLQSEMADLEERNAKPVLEGDPPPGAPVCRQGYPFPQSDCCYFNSKADRWEYFRIRDPEREFDDGYCIPYSPKIALEWDGTHNLLCCSEDWFAGYLLKYCAKCEPVFDANLDRLPEGLCAFLQTEEGKHIHGRVCSMPEVINRLQGIPHARLSEQVDFLTTELPESRIRVVNHQKARELARVERAPDVKPPEQPDFSPVAYHPSSDSVYVLEAEMHAVFGHFERFCVFDVRASFQQAGLGECDERPLFLVTCNDLVFAVELDPCGGDLTEAFKNRVSRTSAFCESKGFSYLRIGADVAHENYNGVFAAFLSAMQQDVCCRHESGADSGAHVGSGGFFPRCEC